MTVVNRQYMQWGHFSWVVSFADSAEILLLPCILVAAWFYYPFCQNGPNLCVWRAVFHHPCIGCGLTRGICFLVHGRVREALTFNPLSPLVLLLLFAGLVQEMLRRAAVWQSQVPAMK
jgi:hypothetical protein